MAKYQYTPPMAANKWKALLVLITAGVLLFLLLLLFVLPTARTPGSKYDLVHGVLKAVMTTSPVVGVWEAVPEAIRWAGERTRFQRFRALFGASVLTDGCELAFPPRRLLDPAALVSVYQPEPDAVPEGVEFWHASEDIRAAGYVARPFGQMGVRKVDYALDGSGRAEIDKARIAFGLGFTAATEHLPGMFEPQAFAWTYWAPAPHAPGGDVALTDHFLLAGEKEFQIERRLRDNPRKGFALVARVVIPAAEPDAEPIVCFVCAGRTAAGTAVAGHFLAKHWPRLNEMYEASEEPADLDRHSLAVRLEHPAGAGAAIKFDQACRVDRHVFAVVGCATLALEQKPEGKSEAAAALRANREADRGTGWGRRSERSRPARRWPVSSRNPPPDRYGHLVVLHANAAASSESTPAVSRRAPEVSRVSVHEGRVRRTRETTPTEWRRSFPRAYTQRARHGEALRHSVRAAWPNLPVAVSWVAG